MVTPALLPAGLAVLAVLGLYYRRFRRLFGRQRVQPARMKARVGLLLVAAALLLLRGSMQPAIGLALAAGGAGGVALAVLGLRLTRFESTPQGRFYTPHGGIGLALSALLLGRLVYRFVVIYPSLQAAHGAGGDMLVAFQRSPLTSALFGLLIGYYVAYGIGVLLRSGSAAAPPGDAS